jgi:hypothetical protein
MLALARKKSSALNLLVAAFLAIHAGIAPLPWAHRHDLPTFGGKPAGLYRDHILRWHQSQVAARPSSLHFHWVVFRSGVPVDGTMPDGPPGREGNAEWVLAASEGSLTVQTLADWLAPCFFWASPIALPPPCEPSAAPRASPHDFAASFPIAATVRLQRWTC